MTAELGGARAATSGYVQTRLSTMSWVGCARWRHGTTPTPRLTSLITLTTQIDYGEAMTAMQNDEGGLQLLTLGGDGDLGYHDTGQGEAIVQVHAARAESAFFFADELPAVQEWVFGSSQAARITQPALVVLGADSAQLTPLVVETVQRLSAMLPHARSQVLPGCSH